MAELEKCKYRVIGVKGIFCSGGSTEKEMVDVKTCSTCMIPSLAEEINCVFLDARRIMESTLPGVVREMHSYHMTCALGNELKLTNKGICMKCPNRRKAVQPDIRSDFVGRGNELAELKKYLGLMLSHNGNTVMVSGELGAGKTRLVNELKKYAIMRNVRFLNGRALYAEKLTPYLPFKEILRAYVDEMKKSGSTSAINDILSAGEISELLPLGLPSGSALKTKDVQIGRERMFEAFYNAIVKMAEEKPLILFVDDLQYADTASLHLLHYLSRNIKNSRIMLIGAYRPEEIVNADNPLSETLGRMDTERLYHTIEVKRLNVDDVKEMIGSITDKGVDDDFIDFIYDKTNGNPLFVEEIIKSSDKMQKTPDTITDLINRRIERLGQEVINVLSYAAVIGSKFSYDTLRDASSIDEEKIVGILESLIKLRVIYEEPTILGLYYFNPPIIKEVVYTGLSEKRAELLHKRVGGALESCREKNLGVLAYHFSKAREYGKALHYSESAGDKAVLSFAPNEAMKYYETALNSFEKLDGKTSEKTGLLSKLGQVYFTVGEFDKSIETYEKQIALCISSDDKKPLAKAYRAVGEIHAIREEWKKSLEYYSAGMQVSEKIKDTLGMAEAKRGIGMVYCRAGKYNEALLWLKQSLNNNEPSLTAHIRMDIGTVYWYLGRYEEAVENYERSLKYFEEKNNKPMVLRAMINTGVVYTKKGEPEKAIACYEKAAGLSKTTGELRLNGYALSNAAEELIKTGNIEKALDYSKKSMEIFEKIGEKHMIANTHMVYGIAYKCRKEWGKSEEHFRKGIQTAEEAHDLDMLSQNYMQYALMHKEKGDIKNALKCFQKTVETCKKLGSRELMEKAEKEIEKLGCE
ncbi:MAG: tetratricopeptide repeat protein [Thermoplasmatales archaeon]|nr:tetratricopeptide repeat protein [Thermoplasmatales archaeon]